VNFRALAIIALLGFGSPALAQTGPQFALASAKTCTDFQAIRAQWPQSQAAQKAKAKMTQMRCVDPVEEARRLAAEKAALEAKLKAATQGEGAASATKRTIFSPTPEIAAQFHAALMSLDAPAIRQMLNAGYDPNWTPGNEKNAALHDVMMVCERYPNHNPDSLVIVVRMLIQAGGNVRAANIYDDTPLTIASSPKYCGPTHRVIALLR